jgi:hypothetical protein
VACDFENDILDDIRWLTKPIIEEKKLYLPVPHPKASHVFGDKHIITDFFELKFGVIINYKIISHFFTIK